MKPLYVYGIIPSGDRIIFDEVCGMDDDADEVYTWPLGDVAAVASASPLDDYRGLKRDEAMRYLVNHQRVVEAVMNNFTVLPVKFGTVLPCLSSMERLLGQGGLVFRQALDRLHGLAQMEVVALWDLQKVFAEIGRDEKVIQLKAQAQAAQGPVGGSGGGPAAESVRIELGRLVKETLEQRRSELARRIAPPLCALSRDCVVNPILDDTIVTNLALLLDGEGRVGLDGLLDQLDKSFGGQLTFRSVGPLPPYSFASVEVQEPSYGAVEQARQLLECGASVSVDEIKRAYYRAAKQVHPDLNAAGQDAEARMAGLTQAYRLLLAVAESQALAHAGAMAGHGDGRCSLDRAAVQSMLLIAVKRQDYASPASPAPQSALAG
jgi:hypothetical protein